MITKRKTRGQETRRNQHAREERFAVAASEHRGKILDFSHKKAIKYEQEKRIRLYCAKGSKLYQGIGSILLFRTRVGPFYAQKFFCFFL